MKTDSYIKHTWRVLLVLALLALSFPLVQTPKPIQAAPGDTLFSDNFTSWESDTIMETTTANITGGFGRWYRSGNATYGVGYATSVDGKTFTRYSGNPLTLAEGDRFPFVMSYNGTYYMFVKDGIAGNLYLYDVTIPTSPVIMNSGNPVMTVNNPYNVAVTVDGAGTWHMLVETPPGQLGYSYSDLATLNFDTHYSGAIIDSSGNPWLTYISDNNSLLAVYGVLAGGIWHIESMYANLSDNLSLGASWHTSSALSITQGGVHIADPDVFLIATDNIAIAGTYMQGPTFQWYSNLSLAQFYTSVTNNTTIAMTPDANNPTMPPIKEVGWELFYYGGGDGRIISNPTSGYILKTDDQAMDPFYETTTTFSDTSGYTYYVDAKQSSGTSRIELLPRVIDASNYIRIWATRPENQWLYQESIGGAWGAAALMSPGSVLWPGDDNYHTIKIVVNGDNNTLYQDGILVGSHTSSATFVDKSLMVGVSGGHFDSTLYTNILVREGASTPLAVTTLAASDITMDKDGVTSVTVSGNLTSTGFEPCHVWLEYGTTPSYGINTANVSQNVTGTFNATLPTDLTPGATYYYQAVAQNIDGTSYGGGLFFTFSMPTMTTQAITNLNIVGSTSATLHGTVTGMGEASDTYIYFQYGPTTSYGSTTPLGSTAAIGAYDATITGFAWDITLHARSVAQVGAVLAYGPDVTLTIPSRMSSYVGVDQVLGIIPLLLIIALLVGSGFLGVLGIRRVREDETDTGILMMGLAFVFFAVAILIAQVALDAIGNLLTGNW